MLTSAARKIHVQYIASFVVSFPEFEYPTYFDLLTSHKIKVFNLLEIIASLLCYIHLQICFRITFRVTFELLINEENITDATGTNMFLVL
jgi:hypothetical protein